MTEEQTTEEEEYRPVPGAPALRAPRKRILECLVAKGALTKAVRVITSKKCTITTTRYYVLPKAWLDEPKPSRMVYLVSSIDRVCEPPQKTVLETIKFNAKDATLTYKLAKKYGCDGYYESPP